MQTRLAIAVSIIAVAALGIVAPKPEPQLPGETPVAATRFVVRKVTVSVKPDFRHWTQILFEDGRAYVFQNAAVNQFHFYPLEHARKQNLPPHVLIGIAGSQHRIDFADDKQAENFYENCFDETFADIELDYEKLKAEQ